MTQLDQLFKPVNHRNGKDVYRNRIMGMMSDYNIPMSEAIWWDFESFGPSVKDLYNYGGISALEKAALVYFLEQKLYMTDIEMYMDIFLGRKPDIVLKKNSESP